MNYPYSIFRITVKAAIWIIGVLCLLSVVWFIANRSLDESPRKDRIAFFESHDGVVPDEQNIAIGILGLTAPKGINFIEHGSEIASLHRNNASIKQIQNMMQGPGTLQPTVNSAQTVCWIEPHAFNYEECIPLTEAENVLQNNKELLLRFTSLYKLDNYSNLTGLYNNDVLIVHRLAMAELYLHLQRNEYEAAYIKWRDLLLLSKRILKGTDSWVGKAIGTVIFAFTLPSLEDIILANPNLAERHKNELLSLLQMEAIEDFNPEGIIRSEYSSLKSSLERSSYIGTNRPVDKLHWLAFHLGQKQRILNRYFDFAQDYTKALHKKLSKIDESFLRLREKHVFASTGDMIIDPFGTLFLSQFIEGQLMARQLVKTMHVAEGRLRLASLYIKIVTANIELDQIQRYIEEDTGSAYYNPFSQSPMEWDRKERTIYFPNKDYECAVYASFRIPDKHKKASSEPKSDKTLC